MSLFDDDQRRVMTGIAIGAGVAVLVKDILPVFAEAGRPLAKGTIKSGVMAYLWTRERLAHLRETTEDLLAEVKAEMEEAAEDHARQVEPGPRPGGEHAA
jgi:hypothetical protein